MAFDLDGFAQALLRCASVTPEDDGALALLGETLGGLGLTVERLSFVRTAVEYSATVAAG